MASLPTLNNELTNMFNYRLIVFARDDCEI